MPNHTTISTAEYRVETAPHYDLWMRGARALRHRDPRIQGPQRPADRCGPDGSSANQATNPRAGGRRDRALNPSPLRQRRGTT